MGLNGAGEEATEAGLDFAVSDVKGESARALLEELNETLIGILGHNGTKHVCMDDFSRDGGFFLVGYDGGIPVCCAGVRLLSGRTGEVKRVFARRNHKGYGAALMAAVEARAAAIGYCRLVLECREGNASAIGFYRRIGYEDCEKYPPYGDEKDAVCMEKLLLCDTEQRKGTQPEGGRELLIPPDDSRNMDNPDGYGLWESEMMK